MDIESSRAGYIDIVKSQYYWIMRVKWNVIDNEMCGGNKKKHYHL